MLYGFQATEAVTVSDNKIANVPNEAILTLAASGDGFILQTAKGKKLSASGNFMGSNIGESDAETDTDTSTITWTIDETNTTFKASVNYDTSTCYVSYNTTYFGFTGAASKPSDVSLYYRKSGGSQGGHPLFLNLPLRSIL